MLSFEDYNQHREKTGVSGVMVARYVARFQVDTH